MAVRAPELFGERVRRLREERGLSMDGLGRATGLSKTAIQNIETKTVDVRKSTLMALASALDVTPANLLKDTLASLARAS